jgi:hypothetical protein
MKSIIHGKTYNTDTAEEIGTHWNGLSRSDFRSCTEALYRTPKGNYFLHGKGGPMTDYARDCGDSRCGGQRLIPMTETDALAWAENKLDCDTIATWFGHLLQEA